MAQVAPSPNNTDNRTNAASLTPPDERFWEHYSPHGEFPLSSVGSFVLHLLLFGLLALVAWLGVYLFDNGSKSLPVEAVRLDLSGGGGDPRGKGEGENNGPALEEAGNQTKEGPAENVNPEDLKVPDIKAEANPKLDPKFDDDSNRRIIQDPNASTSQVISGLRKRLDHMKAQAGRTSGYGKGGTGEGGGSGSGKGRGIGDGRGDGMSTPTQREKRMLRWTMAFNVNNSSQYVSQLRGLGAIVAVPVREDGNGGAEYEIVEDLGKSPTKLVKKDIKEIQRMVYWVDDKPESVRGVLSALGLPLQANHFLAFMPTELEKKLMNLEITYLEKHHPGRVEDDIKSTKFEIRPRGGKYEPYVTKQELHK